MWIADFERKGLIGLLPKARADRGQARSLLTRAWDKQIDLLDEEKQRIAVEIGKPMTTVKLTIQLRLDESDAPLFTAADLFVIPHLPVEREWILQAMAAAERLVEASGDADAVSAFQAEVVARFRTSC